MEKKQFRGEYLAPKIEVIEIEIQQYLLDVSDQIGIGGDPFSGNGETGWAKVSDDLDWTFDE